MLGRASPPFCPAVERVLLNGCGRLTDRGLQTLSRRCPELRHVEMRGCTQVTDVGVLELVSKCVHLSHLDVSGNWPTFYLQNSSAPHNFPNSKFKKKIMRIPPSPLPAQIKKKHRLQSQLLIIDGVGGNFTDGKRLAIIRNSSLPKQTLQYFQFKNLKKEVPNTDDRWRWRELDSSDTSNHRWETSLNNQKFVFAKKKQNKK